MSVRKKSRKLSADARPRTRVPATGESKALVITVPSPPPAKLPPWPATSVPVVYTSKSAELFEFVSCKNFGVTTVMAAPTSLSSVRMRVPASVLFAI